MKTAEERALELFTEMIPYCHEEGIVEKPLYDMDGVINMLTLALKEQDKLTRHACAESLDGVVKFLGMTESEYESRIHTAIINTKAV